MELKDMLQDERIKSLTYDDKVKLFDYVDKDFANLNPDQKSQFIAKAFPEPVQRQPFSFDWVKEQLTPPTMEQAGRIALEQIPSAGMLAGGALGATAAGPMGGVGGAALGGATGQSIKGAIEQGLGLSQITPMENISQIGQAAASGAISQLLGENIGGLITKGLAPAGGRITEKAASFINWAREKSLPYAFPEALGGVKAEVADLRSALGMGRGLMNVERRKLMEGATQAAQNIFKELDLPIPTGTETGRQLSGFLKDTWKSKASYEMADEALKTIPRETPHQATNLYNTILELTGTTDAKEASRLIGEYYSGKKAIQARNVLKNIMDAEGKITVGELDDLARTMHTSLGTRELKERIGKPLKDAFYADTAELVAPGHLESVGMLRKAADAAASEAKRFVSTSPVIGGVVGERGQVKLSDFAVTKKGRELFSDPYIDTAKQLRDRLVAEGREDLWSALKAEKIEQMFQNSLVEVQGQTVFNPVKFMKEYKDNRAVIGSLMPDEAPALQQWFNAAEMMVPQAEKLGKKASFGLTTTALAGGAAYAAGGYTMPIVAEAMPLLAALSTIGPHKIGFLQPYLLRTSVTPLEKAGVDVFKTGVKYDLFGTIKKKFEE